MEVKKNLLNRIFYGLSNAILSFFNNSSIVYSSQGLLLHRLYVVRIGMNYSFLGFWSLVTLSVPYHSLKWVFYPYHFND